MLGNILAWKQLTNGKTSHKKPNQFSRADREFWSLLIRKKSSTGSCVSCSVKCELTQAHLSQWCELSWLNCSKITNEMLQARALRIKIRGNGRYRRPLCTCHQLPRGVGDPGLMWGLCKLCISWFGEAKHPTGFRTSFWSFKHWVSKHSLKTELYLFFLFKILHKLLAIWWKFHLFFPSWIPQILF